MKLSKNQLKKIIAEELQTMLQEQEVSKWQRFKNQWEFDWFTKCGPERVEIPAKCRKNMIGQWYIRIKKYGYVEVAPEKWTKGPEGGWHWRKNTGYVKPSTEMPGELQPKMPGELQPKMPGELAHLRKRKPGYCTKLCMGFPLRKKCRSPIVKEMQHNLNEIILYMADKSRAQSLKKYKLDPDGCYGPRTARLIAYYKQYIVRKGADVDLDKLADRASGVPSISKPDYSGDFFTGNDWREMMRFQKNVIGRYAGIAKKRRNVK